MRLSSLTARAVVLALVVAGMSGLAPVPAQAAGPAVSVHGSLTNIMGNRPTPAGADAAVISAARNEFESFQVVVDAGDAALAGVTVGMDPQQPLTSAGGDVLPSSNITIYREAFYAVDGVNGPRYPSDGESLVDGAYTNQWPDALIPEVDPFYGENRSAFPHNVAANQRVVAWVDMLVPQTQPAGVYSGAVRVTTTGGLLAQVPVTLTVRNFTLPSTSSLQTLIMTNYRKVCEAHNGDLYCGHDQARRWRLHSLYERAALENRVTLANPGPKGFNEGPPTAGNGQLAYWDTYIQPLLDGTSPSDATGMDPVRLPGARMTTYSVMWHCADNPGCVAAWEDFGNERSFSDRMVLYACDEPPSLESWETCKGRLAKPTVLPRLVTKAIQAMDANGATGVTDILVPNTHHLDGKTNPYPGNQRPAYDGYVAAGNKVWSYHSNMSFGSDGPNTAPDVWDIPLWNGWPSLGIDQPAAQARAMGWMAFGYDISGELYWESTERLPTAWTNSYEQGGNGDGTLFYPGVPAGRAGIPPIGGTHEIPVESIRLKRMRDGREDYEYLHRLEQDGRRAEAMAAFTALFGGLDSAMFSVTSAVTHDDVAAVRDQLAALITGDPEPSTAAIAFTRRPPGEPAEVWVMDADGTNQRKVADPGSQPSWSPDGSRIAFTRAGGIHLLDVASGGVTKLVDNGDKAAWAPAGAEIAFVRDGDIHVTPARPGGHVANLTRTAAAQEYDPAWAPGRNVIAYARSSAAVDGGNADIWTMAVDGTNQVKVSDSSDDEDSPAFDNNDTVMSWNALRNGTYELLVDGNSWSDGVADHAYQPTWLVGDLMVHVRGYGPDAELWVDPAHGPDPATQLTDNAVQDVEPDALQGSAADGWLLRVRKTGSGAVSAPSDPRLDGIDCGSDCDGWYDDGSTATLTATPAAGYRFAGWIGAPGCVGTGSCTVTMNVARSITAAFVRVTCPRVVEARSGSFAPRIATAPLGGCVQWIFTGPGAHSVTDSAGLGPRRTPLFSSGSLDLGASYRRPFRQAGVYPYRSAVAGDPASMTGTVRVPAGLSTGLIRRGQSATVTWASSRLTGYRFDVRYRRSTDGGATYGRWVRWRSDTTRRLAAFSPSRRGRYQIVARLEHATTGRMSGWSPASTLRVR